MIVNDKQGTLIFSTPDHMDTVWKVTKIKSIKIEDKDYEVTAYLAPHEDDGRGVVHGIDPRLTIEELTEAFGNPRNPPILGVRKIGNSSSAIVTFKNETVPSFARDGDSLEAGDADVNQNAEEDDSRFDRLLPADDPLDEYIHIDSDVAGRLNDDEILDVLGDEKADAKEANDALKILEDACVVSADRLCGLRHLQKNPSPHRPTSVSAEAQSLAPQKPGERTPNQQGHSTRDVATWTSQDGMDPPEACVSDRPWRWQERARTGMPPERLFQGRTVRDVDQRAKGACLPVPAGTRLCGCGAVRVHQSHYPGALHRIRTRGSQNPLSLQQRPPSGAAQAMLAQAARETEFAEWLL
ncbi:hypothetical protein HPB49_004679 [Dermacentor silvarum]|uniref:Uncharacterized protein n=1 Tax=Dermacentor silvarum TaxID=543639 RepID=A0ACB8C249_DERSI|nr:hypothetical protein HPB49_004679 [Dermacentor silvarum]